MDTTTRTPGGMRQALLLVWRAASGSAAVQVLSALLAGVLPIGLAWLSKLVIDGIAAGDRDLRRLLGLAVAMAVAGLLAAMIPYLMQYAAAQMGRAIVLVAQEALARSVKRLSGLARLEDPVFYDQLRMATQAGRGGPSTIFTALLAIGQGLVTTFGFLTALIVLNPWLMLLALIAAVPTILLQLDLSRRRTAMIWRLSRVERREMFYEGLLTRMDAAKEIRLFGLADFFILRMLRELMAIHREQRQMDRRELSSHGTMAVLGALVAGATIVWAVLSAGAGRLSVGDIAIVVAASGGVVGGLSGAIDRIGALHQALALFDHYRTVVAAPPDLSAPARTTAVEPLRHGIEFCDVWFRYSAEHPWVLNGVNLHIPAGKALGLVGLNGAGKSTLIKLLCRFYDPVRGSIRWDGVDIRDFPVEELRLRIGAVFQDFMTYDLSAAENIGLGDLAQLSDRRSIIAAATSADIHEVVDNLPKGYETLLSRTFPDDDPNTAGVSLSGGQWQRIALARGFLRQNLDLLILDEPSSGLDAEAEYQIHRRLHTLRTGRTSVLISHRLNTIRDADSIAVIEGGRVVEQGNHDALIEGGGSYARLFMRQAQGYLVDVPATSGLD
ncbi:multidrug ABC transporter permease [Catellatospora methionotrophica]|uniref:Multidrug ABC transporter permease n=1 Tax=Catellatospora methionotrophica TaxID=121620 RepID=A0A8J3LQV6_9ACTN|nr:ABC transporter ATP-binding protein [Catellatospora methionotrophica]GIG17175.1 multidrug ABC transporter permease [Catellatospora methionotrophica]